MSSPNDQSSRSAMVKVTTPDIRRWQTSNTGVDFVHHFDSGHVGAHALVCALMHGNEISGAAAVSSWLDAGIRPVRGRLTLAFCNVAAFARFDTNAPDDSRYVDEDMNRVWSPSRLQGTSRDARRAAELKPWIESATHLLDLHSMHEASAPLLMVGPLARNRVFADSLLSGVRAVADAGHADGVRLRDFAAYGDADGQALSILLEAGQHWDPRANEVTRDVFARFILATGVVDAAVLPANWLNPHPQSHKPAIEVTHRIVATSTEVSFTEHFTGGEVIEKAGTVIGVNAGVPITTPHDHCVLVMPSLRQLRAGVTVLRLGRILA